MSINTSTTAGPSLKAAAAATFVVFGINGFVFASWAARIPAVTETLHLTSGQMGTLLLCIAVGSLLALPTAGLVVGKIGTANAVRAGGLLSALAGVGIALSLAAESVQGTAVALFIFGIGVGLWDVSQNIEGADVEHKLRRTIMPQFHAAFSGGAFLGALIGAGLSTIGVGLPLHLLAIAGVVVVVALVAPRYFLPHIAHALPVEGEQKTVKGPSAWRDSRTLLIGVVVLGATLTEGAGNDWIAKATVDGLGASESTGALMFALFVLAMTAMRLFGGRAIDIHGRVVVLRASMAAAAGGLCLFVLAGNFWLAGVGAALWGVGAAMAFPMGMSAAADDPKHAAARVSVVSTLGYVSFLAGPPLLGYLGDLTGIHLALLAILAPIVVAFLLAGAAKPLASK
ncbi:MFS transporter [Pseudarthrobacter sp. AL07]|uniref:MFS transporter n=1 Tax=unclassified Pseudarthrobacter TaxID=2647000 RepID=UPI00249C0595|nr:MULTISPECIES: MFS transporter [unclassified Pseudarthrobacter]MDI3194489.1 MFS transporter [Pseudarthrobacter sp. AL20]MDI3208643.1 MFS transporter [Pseudarthrobacter sp. AL07]